MKTAGERGESLNAVTKRLLAMYGGVDMPPQPWISQPDQVLAFGHVLAEAGVIDTAADAFCYIERPYKWDDLHDEWVRLGCPCPPEREWGMKSDTCAWESFIERVDAEDAPNQV